MKEPFYHNTHYVFSKLKEHNENPFIKELDNYWKPVYNKLENKKIEICKFENATLFQINHEGFHLFFIKEFSEFPYRNNIFFGNFLIDGTIFDEHKDEKILTYRFKDYQKGRLRGKNIL
ncbi:hypothetical protein RRU94_15805 [Domibacillus sp. DTU_2020_1001157_1_SI_ALB_TIR_016]|uniref:hypothetical protein n=1 Tax=Domibacillus sp. DTU_2020_1001157_1_SI_ALB_TIR_016 TaxID=3077789 RepID=UPI0028EA930B|nr:hypothetical protein [Domibacillus sp. DTU_2020_1001157_1_SI_ALB_TIR_016]WNS82207.1 hypothetical protein RRU94_15805 [Domibacillus sp. DTU_2020_1001157_1_SI_ALB_TIR_016]